MRMLEQTADLAHLPQRAPSHRRVVAVAFALKSALVALLNRRAANRLDELDDRQLEDIGLPRGELHVILRGTAFYEDPTRRFALSARLYAEKSLKA